MAEMKPLPTSGQAVDELRNLTPDMLRFLLSLIAKIKELETRLAALE